MIFFCFPPDDALLDEDVMFLEQVVVKNENLFSINLLG